MEYIDWRDVHSAMRYLRKCAPGPLLPPDQLDSYIAGLILLAAASCTAMVFDGGRRLPLVGTRSPWTWRRAV